MSRVIRILELRSALGSGGGPEKTILQGAVPTDAGDFAVTVCYLRDRRDSSFDVQQRASDAGIDYVEIIERHSLDPRVWRELTALVRSRRIDVVHAHDYKTDLLTWMLARRVGVLPLATAHGWTGHSWRERHLYYPADKWLLARFPRVIAVSGEIRDELLRHGARQSAVGVVVNGIDPQRFRREPRRRDEVRAQLGVTPDAVLIGSVGRLEPQKRFDLLIDAIAALRHRHPELPLVIAGAGSLHDALSAQIARLELATTCRLLGHQADVRALYHALDLFVQSSDYEGTSNAVLEAMAMETPIVATNVGGTAELIEHDVDGVLVPPGSADTLALAIAAVIGDPERMARLRVAARHTVEDRLSFRARMRSIDHLYRDISGRPSDRAPHA